MYSLIFPFSEINAAVFQNAAIFLNNKKTGNEFTVYAPTELIGCYFHANTINEIESQSFQNYSTVSRYSLKPFSKSQPKSWLSSQVLNHLHQRVLHSLPVPIFHFLPEYFRSDYKSRKFLFKSGIYKSIKAISKNLDHDFLGTGQYKNLATMQNFSFDQSDYFKNHFRNLELMIMSGGLQNSSSRQNFTNRWLKSLSRKDIDYFDFLNIENFISKNNKVVFIRTRNISGSASIHNTDVDMLENLVKELLKNGYSVISSGTPTFSLCVKDSHYLEASHNLPVVVQQYLASQCFKTVTSAEAGLFTAWASSDMPLVTFGEEWSMTNLHDKISLLDARLKVGVIDSSIGNGNNTEVINKVFNFH